jgi:hypothetical protein
VPVWNHVKKEITLYSCNLTNTATKSTFITSYTPHYRVLFTNALTYLKTLSF